MPLVAALMALAALAGNTVVTAAVTDAWEAARKKFARLLGHGNPDKTKVAEGRLAETHEQLTEATGRIGNGSGRRWRRSGRPGWRTCWKRTPAWRLTCVRWWRRSRRSCLQGRFRRRIMRCGRAGCEYHRVSGGTAAG